MQGGYNRQMTHDGLDRLTAAGSGVFGGDNWHRYTYDALDNMKSWKLDGIKEHNYEYDSKNRLSFVRNNAGAATTALEYDVQGNLSVKNGQTYGFDFGNRLRTVTGKEFYRYDAAGRRVFAYTPNSGNIGSMYGQAGQLLHEWNGRVGKHVDHIYLDGSPLADVERIWSTGALVVTYHHTDALGTPVARTNEAGALLERTHYDPYGGVIGKPIVQGLGYTAHVADAQTGLTYMQQRYYDPTLGRFLSVDPVSASNVNGSNFNRYWYANNNPYKFTHPDGRLSTSNTCSRVGGTSCSGTFAENAIEAGWSHAKRESAATGLIRKAETKLENRPGGNRFKDFDAAASYFRKSFKNVSTYLQLEFGAISEPMLHNITNIVSSNVFDSNGVGVGLSLGPIPAGGSDFHTHPDMRHAMPGFSGDDFSTAMGTKGRYSYVFYGYPMNVGKKLDIQSAKEAGVGAYDSKIHNFVSDF